MAAWNLGQPAGTPAPPSNPNFSFPVRGTPSGSGNVSVGPYSISAQHKTNTLGADGGFDAVAVHYLTVVDAYDPQSEVDARALATGNICFARSNEFRSRRHMQPTSYGVTLGPASVELREVTQLNNLLRSVSETLYTSAAQVLAEFRMVGVIRNETTPYSVTRSLDKPATRILNFVASHYTTCTNMWTGHTILSGQNLYLIVRKNTDHKHYEIVGWTSPNRSAPALADLEPKPRDDSVIGDLGVAVFVGKAVGTHRQRRGNSDGGFTDLDTVRNLVNQGMAPAPIALHLLI